MLGKNAGNSQIRDILVNGVIYREEGEIADGSNMYFTTVAGRLAEDVPQSASSPLSFLSPPLQNSFFLRPVTLEEIIDGLKLLLLTSMKYLLKS